MTSNQLCYLALGTNLGNREDFIKKALLKLGKEVQIRRVSSIYETAPWGLTNQDPFLNLCVEIETTLSPLSLLNLCKAIEQQLGRKKKIHWGPREIDIDIIFYGVKIINQDTLIIPHLELSHRQFVLKPLADLIPEFIHPQLNISIQELSSKLTMIGVDFYKDSTFYYSR